jgi:hypothetical protein
MIAGAVPPSDPAAALAAAPAGRCPLANPRKVWYQTPLLAAGHGAAEGG